MAHKQRTYQWVNGRIQDVGSIHGMDAKEARSNPLPKKKKQPGIDIQTALLVFTCSTVLMVFAGGALCVFLLVTYSIIFG